MAHSAVVAVHHRQVGGQIYAALIAGHQALRAGIGLINAGVYVGQAAWQQFFGDTNGFIEKSVDAVSDLNLDTAISVFGKGHFQDAGSNVEENTAKALRRITNGLAMLRRYTNAPGVMEKVQRAMEPQTGVANNFRVRWHRIKGLAVDEVFLVQKIRIRWKAIGNSVGGWQGLIVGRPWGAFQWTGDDFDEEIYPNEGDLYAGQDIGINTIEDFFHNTKMNWVLTTATAEQRAFNYDLDLAPNFIALRSYQIITEDSIDITDQATVLLEGKSVKWLLPFEQFD